MPRREHSTGNKTQNRITRIIQTEEQPHANV